MKRKLFLGSLLGVLLLAGTFAAVNLRGYYLENQEQEQSFEIVREHRISLNSLEASGIKYESLALHDAEQLREQNPDYTAWLTIDGTKIDYPVMQTPENPEYYLHKSFTHRESRYGVPFLDARCDLDQSGQLIIYGHNMIDGAMFHDLEGYLKNDFLLAHPFIVLETAEEMRQYRIFAALKLPGITLDNDWTLLSHLDPTEEEWNNLMSEVAKRKISGTEELPPYGGQLLTLVTCDNTYSEERIAILGIQEE